MCVIKTADEHAWLGSKRNCASLVAKLIMKPPMTFYPSIIDPIKTEFDGDHNLTLYPREDQIMDLCYEKHRIVMTVVREAEDVKNSRAVVVRSSKSLASIKPPLWTC